MKKLATLFFCFAVSNIISSNAQAQATSSNGNGLYIAAGVSRISTETTINEQNANFSFNDSDDAFNFRLGYQFTSWFGVEAAVYDLGEFENALLQTAQELNLSSSDISLDLKGYGLSLVGVVPLDTFNLYGKMGAMRLEGEAQAQAFGVTIKANDATTQPFITVGGELKLGKVNLFAEYSRLFEDDTFEVNLATVGIKLGL